jgi:transketolase
MRNAFIAELYDLAAEDDGVLLLSGDIGFKVFDRFRDDYQGRYFNMGIAEANMMGVAAGMAMSGKRPVVYTIIPFLTMRAFEQIRVDVAMQNQPVMIVGVGGGLAYDILGPTHHSIEDVAIIRALPNMTVLTPCDPAATRAATRAAYELNGPVYIRLGKNGEPSLHGNTLEYELGKAVTMRAGRDVTLIGCGPILNVGLQAADLLADRGVSCRVIDMHTIKPFDSEAVLAAARETRAMVSLEEHNIIGGLGSAVAEVLAENASAIPFKRIGVPDVFTYEVGSQEHLFKKHGLTAENIAATLASLNTRIQG